MVRTKQVQRNCHSSSPKAELHGTTTVTQLHYVPLPSHDQQSYIHLPFTTVISP